MPVLGGDERAQRRRESNRRWREANRGYLREAERRRRETGGAAFLAARRARYAARTPEQAARDADRLRRWREAHPGPVLHRSTRHPARNGRKVCASCLVEQPVAGFCPNSRTPDGVCGWCSTCKRARASSAREYRARPEVRERGRAASLAYYQRNAARINAARRAERAAAPRQLSEDPAAVRKRARYAADPALAEAARERARRRRRAPDPVAAG